MSILRYKQKLLPLGNPQSGGGSGGGGTTQSVSNSYSSVSPWAAPYVTSMLGAAQQQVFQTDPTTGQITGITPYSQYGLNGAGQSAADMQAAQSSVAGFSPLQQQSFNSASQLQTPGQFGQGSMAAGMGTMQALGAGQNLQNTLTNSNAMSQYMNPYIQNTLNPALQLSNQQYGITGMQNAAAATGAGAFGGSRSALQQGLNQQNQMLANNQLISNAYNTAYNNAQTQANNVANLGLQGAQAGITGGTALGNLGTAQLGAQQNIINQQNTLGQQGTAQNQAVINQAMQNYQTGQQYPMTQLTNLKNLISGFGTTDTTQTAQSATPGTAQLIGGAGLAGLGMVTAANNSPTINVNSTPTAATNDTANAGGASGGIASVKHGFKKAKAGGIMKMANGGIANAIYRKALNDPSSVPQQSLQDGTIQGLPAQLVQAMQANEKQQAQQPQQAPTSTVIQDIDAKQQQMQMAQDQKLLAAAPTILADLQVKRDIAKEKGDKKEVKKLDLAIDEITAKAQGVQAQMQAQAPQGQPQMAQGPQAAPPPQGIDAAMAQQQQAQAAQAQQPQQQDQAPQGIAQAAGGGIMAFRKGGEVKRFVEGGDIAAQLQASDPMQAPVVTSDNAVPNDKYLESIRASMRPQAATTAVTPAPVPAPNNSNLKPDNLGRYDANAGKANSQITIGPRGSSNPKPPTGPGTSPAEAIPQYDVKGATSDITNMIGNWSGMLNSLYNKDTTSDNLSNAFFKASQGMSQGIGRQALANAIGGFSSGYQQSQQSNQERKDKQLQQLMTLGLTGQQLQMEAAKLGISQAELNAKIPVLNAQANLYKFKAAHPGGATAGMGSVGGATVQSELNSLEGYKANPKSAPFFNSLPQDVQTGLSKYPVGSQSYKNAKAEFDAAADKYTSGRLNVMRAYGAKATPTVVNSDEI
jgi:hypothetical protein